MDDLDGVDVLCHTGGPRVLREVAKALGVQSQNLHSSLEVMRNNGNLSGASNLCVLDHHSQLADLSDRNMNAEAAASIGMGSAPARPTSEWAVGLSMGPGVCLEGVLLRDVRRKAPPMSRVRSMEDLSSVGREAITRGLGEIDTRKGEGTLLSRAVLL
jgi:predicted naringenin-chalcone synthase